jgi:hypothetical protein
MHPTTSELLALRDGEAASELAEHVAGCASCGRELERLRALRDAMRELPELEAPNDGWDGVRAELLRSRRVHRVRRGAMLAAAAIVVGLLASVALRPGVRQAAGPAPAEASEDRALAELITASRELESVLKAPTLRSPVLSPPEAARIVALEDRVAVIDLQLAVVTESESREHAVALWSDRVGLLDELVRARGRPSQDSGAHAAVLTHEGRRP